MPYQNAKKLGVSQVAVSWENVGSFLGKDCEKSLEKFDVKTNAGIRLFIRFLGLGQNLSLGPCMRSFLQKEFLDRIA